MAYRTAEAAQHRALHHRFLPTLVRLPNGMYDTFPHGCPLPIGSTILARKFSPAMGGWTTPTVVITGSFAQDYRVQWIVKGETFDFEAL